MAKKYDEHTRARAVRLVREQRAHYRSRTEACEAVAKQEGVAKETLRRWVAQDDVDTGAKAGVTSEEHTENTRLRAEVKKLRDQVEILSAATTFFAGALVPRKREVPPSRKR